MTEGAYIGPHHAALVLAYSDYSNECWEMADEWEAIGKDLGRCAPSRFLACAPPLGRRQG